MLDPLIPALRPTVKMDLDLKAGRGAALAGIGIAIGMMIAIPLTRAMRGLFVGVEPTDPLTLGGVALLLLAVSVLACYLPARRAAKLDPAASLRAT